TCTRCAHTMEGDSHEGGEGGEDRATCGTRGARPKAIGAEGGPRAWSQRVGAGEHGPSALSEEGDEVRRKRSKAGRQRGHVFAHGRWWWIQYRAAGERVRANSHVPLTDPQGRELAEKALEEKLKRVDESPMIAGRLTFEQLQDLVLKDYRLQ